MPLSPGTHLGPYEILDAIGAGGMGEVYRARDRRLDRDVAIKILSDAWAADAGRIVRFDREAKTLAALNHPNIAHIHGLEESDSGRALVMELVEGPTLAERIAHSPISVDEALTIARQIAEALEAAHEQGVIHRDLKPANIKVRADSMVKVLDFGLAKLADPLGPQTDFPGLHTPTMTSPVGTRTGMILGTPAYMSPEQAKGSLVDRRTDIWAFGCVLFEMLTGRAAFPGETLTERLAAVIRAEPDWRQLPAATPSPVLALLRRCLRKNSRDRLQAIGDARIALEEIISGAEPAAASSTEARLRPLPLAMGLAGALIVGVVAGLLAWNLKPSSTPLMPVTRFTITLPPGQQLAGFNQPTVALSADGTQFAYVATVKGGAPQIYLRAMDGVEPKPIDCTEGGANPFFSPDGQWLGFFASGKLTKVSVHGGVAQALTDVAGGGFTQGAVWIGEHTIVFAPLSSALLRISDGGGAAQPVTRLATGEDSHMWPQPMPGSKGVLFNAFSSSPGAIAIQPFGKGERRDLIRGPVGTMASYLPSGHLTYAQEGRLMAVPFDLERLEVTGQPVPVVHDLLNVQAPQYSISATGSLVYVPGSRSRNRISQGRLVWVNRDGTEQSVGTPARTFNQPRLSPDGRRLAVDVIEPHGMQVWLYDFARDTFAPFTFDGVNRHAIWTPDGKRLAFMSNREGATQIFWQLADGSGGLERLTRNPPTTAADVLTIPYSWSPDGQRLLYLKLDPSKGPELWVLHAGASDDREAQRLPLQIRSPDGGPELSPDGHWLAYATDDGSGHREVFVQPYPGPGGKWQVSTDGGNEPLWNPNGRELFYRNGDRMMAVDITTQPGFAAGKPRQLFKGSYLTAYAGWVRPNYDVSPDGQRFLMLKPDDPEQVPLTQINVVLNWSEELKRLVPSK